MCVSEERADSVAPSLLSYTLRYVSLAELGTLCRVGLRDPMNLCTCVSEEGGDGEGADSEAPLGTLCRVGLREPMHLCAYMDRGEDAEEATSLLSYTLLYVSLVELVTVSRVGSREPIHLCTCVSEEGGDREGAGEGGDASNVL